MKTIAEYNLGGISFFIPYNEEDEFTKDIMPEQEEESENGSEEAAKHAAWVEVQAQQYLDDEK